MILYADDIRFDYSIFTSDIKIHSIKPESYDASISLSNTDIKGTLDISKLRVKSLKLDNVFANSINAYNTKFITKPIISDFRVSDIVNFNHTSFEKGLDLDDAYFSGTTFFNGITLSSSLYDNSCSAATYCMIKDSLDKSGNTIEANKYFALEMDKLYSELKWHKNFPEKLLLSINKCSSNFGQNWWLPIVWMIGFASLFYCLREYDPFDYPCLNGIASFIIPYQGIIGESHQMSKLLTSLLFGVLIYQTTVALKRKTRR